MFTASTGTGSDQDCELFDEDFQTPHRRWPRRPFVLLGRGRDQGRDQGWERGRERRPQPNVAVIRLVSCRCHYCGRSASCSGFPSATYFASSARRPPPCRAAFVGPPVSFLDLLLVRGLGWGRRQRSIPSLGCLCSSGMHDGASDGIWHVYPRTLEEGGGRAVGGNERDPCVSARRRCSLGRVFFLIFKP